MENHLRFSQVVLFTGEAKAEYKMIILHCVLKSAFECIKFRGLAPAYVSIVNSHLSIVNPLSRYHLDSDANYLNACTFFSV